MGVGVLVRLFHYRIFEVIAFAKRAVTVVVVIHPLVDRRSLFADGRERRVWVQQGQRGSQPVVGNSIHSHLTGVVRQIFQQPFDAVVGIRRLVRGLRVGEVHL